MRPLPRPAPVIAFPRGGLAALIAAALWLAPGPAAANPYFETCMSPDASAAGMADSCRRALKWGGLDKREQAAAWTNIGVANAELGRHGDALAAYDRAEAVDPGFFALYPNRALSRASRGQVRGALADYQTALRLKPGDAGSLMGRGAFYLKRGVADLALQDFDRVLAKDRENVDALFNRAMALAALERRREAAESFTRVLRLAPGDASAHLQRGLARERDDPRGAAEDYAAAMRLDPFWSQPHVARGLLRDRLGDREGANKDFRRAFELGHQAEWLTERIRAIQG